MNEEQPVNSNDMLKLLQNAKASLQISYNEKEIAHRQLIKQANLKNDEILRVEGAIQQIDIFIKQLEGKL